MAGTLGEEARKLLQQIAMNQEAEPIDVTADAAKELLRFGYIAIKVDNRGHKAADEPLRWVNVTDPGRALLNRFYSIPPDRR